MGYREYLIELLHPLGVYDHSVGGIAEAELTALGAALDQVEAKLLLAQREALPNTAQELGLQNWENLVRKYPASQTIQQRQDALIALLQIRDGDITLADINRAVSGCGILAQVQETQTAGLVEISFPGTVGEPVGFARMHRILSDILPAHLQGEYRLLFLTWEMCQSNRITWAMVAASNYTWANLRLQVETCQ